MANMSVADFMLYSATKLTTLKGGSATSTGSGFFYRYRAGDDQYVQMLVTNKHVIEGCDQVTFTCHNAVAGPAPSGEFTTCTVDIDQSNILNHPDADVCAIAIGNLLNQAQADGPPLFFASLDKSHIPSAETWANFDAIEPVTMVGCPNGLFDVANALPIARSGSTASHPSKRYQGKDEFLVDLACFPGSSGSPVFRYSTGASFNRATGEYVTGPIHFALLGILYAGPFINNTGEIVLSKRPTFEIASMMHLGQVIRSTALLKFDEMAQNSLAAGGTL